MPEQDPMSEIDNLMEKIENNISKLYGRNKTLAKLCLACENIIGNKLATFKDFEHRRLGELLRGGKRYLYKAEKIVDLLDCHWRTAYDYALALTIIEDCITLQNKTQRLIFAGARKLMRER